MLPAVLSGWQKPALKEKLCLANYNESEHMIRVPEN
jgi:hypothetical protein